VREGQQLAGHNLVESIDARDAVAQRDDRAGLVHGDLGFVVLDLFADQFRDFVCFDLRHKSALSLWLLALSYSPLQNLSCGAPTFATPPSQTKLEALWAPS
jgi:hypothetical protein